MKKFILLFLLIPVFAQSQFVGRWKAGANAPTASHTIVYVDTLAEKTSSHGVVIKSDLKTLANIVFEMGASEEISLTDGTDTYYLLISSDAITFQDDAGTPNAIFTIDSTGNARAYGKLVSDDSARVNLTSLLKGKVTASADIAVTDQIDITDGTDTYTLKTASDKLTIQNDAPATIIDVDSSGNVNLFRTLFSWQDKVFIDSTGIKLMDVTDADTTRIEHDGTATVIQDDGGAVAIKGEATALYLDYGSSGTEDHDVTIYFGDDGNNTDHSFSWNDGSSWFAFSDKISINGYITFSGGNSSIRCNNTAVMNIDNDPMYTTFAAGCIVTIPDTLLITDSGGADSTRLYDNGTNFIISPDNPILLNNTLLSWASKIYIDSVGIYGMDVTDADTFSISDDGTNFIIDPDNPMKINGAGGSVVTFTIDGNKTSGNIFQAINDNDGAIGDSSVYIESDGDFFARDITAEDNLLVNTTVADQETPIFSVSGDADSDASATTSETLGLTLNANATPGNANWAMSSTNTLKLSMAFPLMVNSYLKVNSLTAYIETNSTSGYIDYRSNGASSYLRSYGSAHSTNPNDFLINIAPNGTFTIDGNKTTANILEVINDNDGAVGDSSTTISSTGMIVTNGATNYQLVVSLTDGAQHLLPTGVAGFGQAKATGAWVFFHFESDGTVTLEDHVNGSTTEDNDATLNVFDDGDGIAIENELGGTMNVLIDVTYYTP